MAVAHFLYAQRNLFGVIYTDGSRQDIYITDDGEGGIQFPITFYDSLLDETFSGIAYFLGYTNTGIPVFDIGADYYLTDVLLPEGSPAPAYTSDVPFTACFLAGAMIATPGGESPVETLTIGDQVRTADGGVAAVKWIGRQSVAPLFGMGPERAPIRIQAGAFGENLPARDLKLTADHALLLDGVLVQAGALVNGATIRPMTAAETGERYTVFHIETEGHQIILAEGVAAETFVDTLSRRRFDNYAEYQALFGEETQAMAELDLPRVKSARQLPERLRARFAARQAA